MAARWPAQGPAKENRQAVSAQDAGPTPGRRTGRTGHEQLRRTPLQAASGPATTLQPAQAGAPDRSAGASKEPQTPISEAAVADVIGFVVSVGGFTCAVLCGSLWILLRPQSKLARGSLIIAVGVYALASVYVVPHLATRLLALGYHPLGPQSVEHRPTAIVVLGSGSFTAKDWDDSKFSLVDPIGASRVLEAARVYRFANAQWVISSGGVATKTEQRAPSGATMRDMLVHLGIPPSQIVVETESRNTHEEAEIIRPILARLGVQQVILVTTPEHMRRSVGTFRAAGIDVVPAIARDPFAADPWIHWLVPSQLGLSASNLFVHEVVGLVYYVLRGWYGSQGPGIRNQGSG
jgi:uncharacterized SAM-binding protein YcdF (DUF218 family)